MQDVGGKLESHKNRASVNVSVSVRADHGERDPQVVERGDNSTKAAAGRFRESNSAVVRHVRFLFGYFAVDDFVTVVRPKFTRFC